MIEKNITFSEEGRGELRKGIDILAKAVASTLGASGRTVINQLAA